MDSILLIVDVAACATLGRDVFVQKTLVLAARVLTLLWSLHGQTFGWCFQLIDSQHPEQQMISTLSDDAAANPRGPPPPPSPPAPPPPPPRPPPGGRPTPLPVCLRCVDLQVSATIGVCRPGC